MNNSTTLEELFDCAVAAIPYDLEPTSITMGNFEPDKDDYLEYSAEYTFTAGKLIDKELVAGGWVELRRDNGEDVTISAIFSVSLDGDWEKGHILPEGMAIQGVFDIAQNTWEFWIEQY